MTRLHWFAVDFIILLALFHVTQPFENGLWPSVAYVLLVAAFGVSNWTQGRSEH